MAERLRRQYRVVAHGERMPLIVLAENVSRKRAEATVRRSAARNARVQTRRVSPWTDTEGERG